jgi:hypothetical protein
MQAKAGKLTRIVRLIRLIRVVKLYKGAQQHIKREETKRIIQDLIDTNVEKDKLASSLTKSIKKEAIR